MVYHYIGPQEQQQVPPRQWIANLSPDCCSPSSTVRPQSSPSSGRRFSRRSRRPAARRDPGASADGSPPRARPHRPTVRSSAPPFVRRTARGREPSHRPGPRARQLVGGGGARGAGGTRLHRNRPPSPPLLPQFTISFHQSVSYICNSLPRYDGRCTRYLGRRRRRRRGGGWDRRAAYRLVPVGPAASAPPPAPPRPPALRPGRQRTSGLINDVGGRTTTTSGARRLLRAGSARARLYAACHVIFAVLSQRVED
jgi:hypothetical protein